MWFVLTCAAAGCLWLTRVTSPRIDTFLRRLAGLLFFAAGLAGLTGWLGQTVTALLHGSQSFMDSIGHAAVGSALYWIVAAALGIAWIVGMLPDRIARGGLPTWLLVIGLILPAMLASVPGRFGGALRSVTYAAGGAVGSLLNGLIS